MTQSQGDGLRYDEGKPRVDLLPADALLELGQVYGVGAKKYAVRNWEKGMKWSKVLGPLLRHLFKWMMGHERDEESGQRHIAMVAWNAIGLLTYELRGIGEDDRGIPKTVLAGDRKDKGEGHWPKPGCTCDGCI